MKKTNKELLQFFGLKVGDKVKIEGFTNPFVIFEESGIQYVNWICNSAIIKLDIIDFIHKLLGNEYEIIKPKKKVGELICDEEIICAKCPLKAINCSYNNDTLYEQLESYKKSILSFGDLKPFEKAFIDALKAELDKDVEELK